MDSRESFFGAIRALTGQQNTLVIPRELVHFLGDINAALLLSQLIYWHDRGGKDGWIYKTYAEWNEEIALSEYQVRRASNLLEKKGFLTMKIKKANGSPTVHYRLEWVNFSGSFLKFLQERSLRNLRIETEVSQGTLTEITSETTTKTTSFKDAYVVPIIEHLNKRCSVKYKTTTPKTHSLIRTRVSEGFTLDDFFLVIDAKAEEWLNNPKYKKFLRPETLFGSKFEGYLNTASPTDAGTDDGSSAEVDPDMVLLIEMAVRATGGEL